jgi:hypothetical protein
MLLKASHDTHDRSWGKLSFICNNFVCLVLGHGSQLVGLELTPKAACLHSLLSHMAYLCPRKISYIEQGREALIGRFLTVPLNNQFVIPPH